MATENETNGVGNNHQRKSLGQIPVEKLSKLPEFRNYQSCSANFTKAKEASAVAKEKMREALKKGSPALRDVQHLEFQMSQDGQSLTIFEKLGNTTQRKASRRNEIQFK